jgi:hypothetical protein
MKKFLALICSLLMVIGFSGCVSYSEPSSGGNTTDNGETDTSGGSDETPTPPAEDGVEPFTATLYWAGYKVSPKEDIYAIWTSTDGREVYTAKFEDGVASTTKPDGDYVVTLSTVPSGYTYDPNIYSATNNEKDVSIVLYTIKSTTGKSNNYVGYKNGSSFTLEGGVYEVPTTGAYRVTLKSADDVVYFVYRPTETGYYTVTSMMDVTANVINPILDKYTANAGGFYMYQQTQDGGGASNTYTKNFLYEMTLNDVGNLFGFSIRTTSLNASAFPVDIDFVLDKDGELSGTSESQYQIMYPTQFTDPAPYKTENGEQLYYYTDDAANKVFVYEDAEGAINQYYYDNSFKKKDVLDGLTIKKREINGEVDYCYTTRGTDVALAKATFVDFYELYTAFLDAKKGTFTYSYKENTNNVLDESLYEYNSNIGAYCRYDKETKSFLYYDEAKTIPIVLFVNLLGSSDNIMGDLFSDTLITLRCNGKDYERFFRAWDETGSIVFNASGTDWNPVKEYTYTDGSGNEVVNTTYSANVYDGKYYPVTEELKVFLYEYSVNSLFFNDGDGTAEKTYGLNSPESDQWLFACGTFK